MPRCPHACARLTVRCGADGVLSHRPNDVVDKLERAASSFVALLTERLDCACCVKPVSEETLASPLLPAASMQCGRLDLAAQPEDQPKDVPAVIPPASGSDHTPAASAPPHAAMLGLSQSAQGIKAICGPSLAVLTVSVGSCVACWHVLVGQSWEVLRSWHGGMVTAATALLACSWIGTALMLRAIRE